MRRLLSSPNTTADPLVLDRLEGLLLAAVLNKFKLLIPVLTYAYAIESYTVGSLYFIVDSTTFFRNKQEWPAGGLFSFLW